jgi:Dyp-type peroxidase family
VDLNEIQGLIAHGYGRLKVACFLPMTVRDPAAARTVLAGWADRVTTAVDDATAEAMNLAFTAEGLTAVTGWKQPPAGFSYPFLDGMTSEYRSRFLGDLDGEDPRHWDWGGPLAAPVHALVLLYAPTLERLREQTNALAAEAAAGGLDVSARLESGELSDREPFGFADSISQPSIAGMPGRANEPGEIRAGEFVLGYENEYGQLTERPMVDSADDPDGLLPRSADGRADLGRNGTYLVLRQLEQDVDDFWRFVDEHGRLPDGTADRGLRDRLAAKIVGRWPSGAPLVLAPDRDRPDLGGRNDFQYHAADPQGLACPIGSHIRRVNPRDALDPEPGTARSIEVNRRHRLLRRGRSYRAAEQRGIYFLCLNANLARQYEFVQHTWINNPVFNGLHDEPDPLVGTRHTGGDFTEPARPVRHRYRGLPQFVRVRGGAYFFLPGRSALRFLTDPRRGLS